ncbi:MAG TPA: DUF1697 domain-containing protein [Gemmatimonadaceae bacterium]|nr:DUF1697 domain-containing protein [Gemmatimonadaceae bacterium]
MALVVLLRGVNVGGHRTFRPTLLAQRLRRFDVVNVGAAGTFVVRQPVRQATLRAEIARLLPFDTQIMVCTGSDVLRFVASDPVALLPTDPRIVAFVSVLPKRCQPASPLPRRFPATGAWGLKIVGQQGRFVFGAYRREMRAIDHLAQLDRLFGVPTTTRSWSTMVKIARVLSGPTEESVAAVAPKRRRSLGTGPH